MALQKTVARGAAVCVAPLVPRELSRLCSARLYDDYAADTPEKSTVLILTTALLVIDGHSCFYGNRYGIVHAAP